MNKKPIFEWVVVPFSGEELCLTENQFRYYQEHRREGVVSFDDFEINPAGVSQSYRRPAEFINRKYPCLTCNTNGHLVTTDKFGKLIYTECKVCGGTGVDFNYGKTTE